MAGKVVWLTGIPGADKTTIGLLLRERLQQEKKQAVLLDGDKFRQERAKDLGFSVKDRKENLRRAIAEAKYLSSKGNIVIVAFTSPFEDMREQARQEFPMLLVHVKASVETCEKRDPKGLYKQAREGKISNFVPFDIAFDEPKSADIILDTEYLTPEQCVDRIMSALRSFDYSGNGYLSYEEIYLTNIQRNRSLIKTTASVMAGMCVILSAYFLYSDIFLTVPAGALSFSPKLLVSVAMAVGASIISYNIKTFTKSRAKLKITREDAPSRQTLYNRIILVASATFCVIGFLCLYYDLDVIPPVGQWNFADPFYVGMGFLAGSVGTLAIYGLKKSRILASKNS